MSHTDTPGDDGLTDAERTMLAKKYEATAASMTSAEIRATLDRLVNDPAYIEQTKNVKASFTFRLDEE